MTGNMLIRVHDHMHMCHEYVHSHTRSATQYYPFAFFPFPISLIVFGRSRASEHDGEWNSKIFTSFSRRRTPVQSTRRPMCARIIQQRHNAHTLLHRHARTHTSPRNAIVSASLYTRLISFEFSFLFLRSFFYFSTSMNNLTNSFSTDVWAT